MFKDVVKQFSSRHIFHYHKYIRWSTDNLISREKIILLSYKARQTLPITIKASDVNKLLSDNNTDKTHHVNQSDFFQKTWLSRQDLE